MANTNLNTEFIKYLNLANELVDGDNNSVSTATQYCNNAREVYHQMIRENNSKQRSLVLLNKLESSLGLTLTQ